ncbi:DUF4097 family beta strand repeat protein [Weissella confusa]|uniref:DUF4097 family beta strand repeat protein n=1 Tax=Weissella confusa TaxID=1583 RepID=A0A923NFN4_WEICO|nr:DUF4097 family beta strand repeat protein [Weissella confusa]
MNLTNWGFTTTNGAIALEDTNLHAVHSKSQNSAFKAENLTLTDASDITSTNGMIKLEDSHFPGLDASTHNGYVHHMIFSFGNYDPKVTVTVPFSVSLDNLKITTTNGGMIVQGQNVKNTTVSNSNGGVRFENLQGEQLNIKIVNVSTTHKTFKDAQVQNLEVDAGNNLVEIVRGTEWGVKATGTSNKVLTDLQDKTLRIDAPDDNRK